MTRRLAPWLLLLVLAACAGPPPLPPGPGCQVKRVATLPVLMEQGAALVPVRIDDSPVLMEVDTGSMTTLIAQNAAARLNLPPDPDRGARLHGTGGVIVTRNALVRKFELGGIVWPPRSLPTGPLARQFSGLFPVAGLLGASDLARFDVELDVRAGQMTLWSVTGCSGAFLPWSEPYRTVPLTADGTGLLHASVLVNGRPLRALIDWGARTSQITVRAARSVGVTADRLASDPGGFGHGIDQTAIALRGHRFDSFGVGDETFRDIRISVGALDLPDAEMLLGMDYARSRRIWLSYATKQMFVAPRPGSR